MADQEQNQDQSNTATAPDAGNVVPTSTEPTPPLPPTSVTEPEALSPTGSPIPAGQSPLTAETATAPASAPAIHRNPLQELGHLVEVAGEDVIKGIEFIPKIIAGWNQLAPAVKAVAAQLLHDTLVIATDVAAEGVDIGNGNAVGAVDLSPATWSAIGNLVADFHAGDATIMAAFKALGVTPPPVTPIT